MEIDIKRKESLKQPLLHCDYLSDEDEEKKPSITKRSQSKVSPKDREEEKGPSKSFVSPSNEPDMIMQSSEIKENWFRRMWNAIIRKGIDSRIEEMRRG